MGKPKHTSGPWKAKIYPGKPRLMTVFASDGKREVVHWMGFDSSHIESRSELCANARLIAKAPDMAKRLEEIAAIIESVDDRCMAHDGPVGRTKDEITPAEIKRIYKLARGVEPR